jgi:hypothetical protein
MSDRPHNPFDHESEPDRHAIWEMMIIEDSEAFVSGDWKRIEGDFAAESFEGIRCEHSTDPANWRIAFADLVSYRDSWLSAAAEFSKKRFVGRSHRDAIYARTKLVEIQIAGDRALARKTFSGELPLEDGTMLSGDRQTLYRLHRRSGRWKVVGFIGQLPLDVKS